MRRTRFDGEPCPVARATDLIGDWWTPIVLREAFFGCRRFEQFHARLGVSRATLTARLNRLVDEGLMERSEYQDAPVRYEYRLTPKGRAFFDVIAVMWQWGDDWLFADQGAPVELVDKHTGERVIPAVVDANTGQPIDSKSIRVRRARRPEPA